ncbi:hypothetical protein ROZALSC1DRAFT_26393, partial [Rozella allomycis CSF55]
MNGKISNHLGLEYPLNISRGGIKALVDQDRNARVNIIEVNRRPEIPSATTVWVNMNEHEVENMSEEQIEVNVAEKRPRENLGYQPPKKDIRLEDDFGKKPTFKFSSAIQDRKPPGREIIDKFLTQKIELTGYELLSLAPTVHKDFEELLRRKR